MYGYRRDTLLKIGTLPQSTLERVEKLEQLNWLFHGLTIHAVETEYNSLGIDTPADLAMLEKLLSPSE